MIHFKKIKSQEFLAEYWQKKPLVIREALPQFKNALTPDELAGLAMEEDIESRIVFETAEKPPYWHLKRGPFLKKDFKNLPKTHWTLLLQGVDRFIPEVAAMLDYFDFIPQWRIDDVMISYAVEEGSVGPHYDNYDVFLYQAKGRRKWLLTSKNCNKNNYLPHIDLRIMKDFDVEEEYILEEGDMLYLPPHIGHHGISLSEECMTYSFGYRSYQGQELLDSFADYLAEKKKPSGLYRDPNWAQARGKSELPEEAWRNAKKLLLQILDDEEQLKTWFGCFATRLDQQAEDLLPIPLDEDMESFVEDLTDSLGFALNPLCRFAYQLAGEGELLLFINGTEWEHKAVSADLIKLIADSRFIESKKLLPFLENKHNKAFVFELWNLQWLEAKK